MKLRRLCALLLSFAMLFSLLSGCGGGESGAPVEYRIGDDFLPSITQLATPGEDAAFSQEGEEDAPSYHYTGLESGSAMVTEYVDTLVSMYHCSVLDEENRETELGALAEEGSLRVGMAGSAGNGLFVLDIRWGTDSCTVSPQFLEGAQIQPAAPSEDESITMAEAVTVLEEFSPQSLGLAGTDLSVYYIYPDDGIVMVNGEPCFQLDAYTTGEHKYAGTYMVSATGEQVYRLDRLTGEVTQLR